MKLFFRKQWARLTINGARFDGPFFPGCMDDLNHAYELFLQNTSVMIGEVMVEGHGLCNFGTTPTTSDGYSWDACMSFMCDDRDAGMLVLFPHQKRRTIEAERSIALYTYGDPPAWWMSDIAKRIEETLLGFRHSFTRGRALPLVRP